MSEKALQEGIQAVIQDISAFDNADVAINDWTLLDQSTDHAPYVRIENADTFNSRQDVKSPDNTWPIPVTLIEAFDGWETTLNNFRNRRQAIIDEFNTVSSHRSANGLNATTIDSIRSDSPIVYVYESYGDEKIRPEQTPIYIQQTMIFEAREF